MTHPVVQSSARFRLSFRIYSQKFASQERDPEREFAPKVGALTREPATDAASDERRDTPHRLEPDPGVVTDLLAHVLVGLCRIGLREGQAGLPVEAVAEVQVQAGPHLPPVVIVRQVVADT